MQSLPNLPYTVKGNSACPLCNRNPGPDWDTFHVQSSADKALDKLHKPLCDWKYLRSDLRISRRVRFLQR